MENLANMNQMETYWILQLTCCNGVHPIYPEGNNGTSGIFVFQLKSDFIYA